MLTCPPDPLSWIPMRRSLFDVPTQFLIVIAGCEHYKTELELVSLLALILSFEVPVGPTSAACVPSL